MSSQLLFSELTALSSEARRKCPDVRAASDAALAALRTHPDEVVGSGTGQDSKGNSNVLLQPIKLSCDGKTAPAKVVGIAVGLLQRVIGLRALQGERVEEVVDMLAHVVDTRIDVDIHLKVLQVVATLLSTYPQVHDATLCKTLRLCFRLQQESRVGVIRSTAAATLRQAVMTVFEKVRDEDAVLDGLKAGGEDAAAAAPLAVMTVPLPSGGSATLFPSSADTFRIMHDLNSLANNENAPFLGLTSLSKTFTLELIESILTNHARLFRSGTHPELLLCLRESTCPLLIKAFNEQASFPVTLRLMRVLFVLLHQFNTELNVEVEILMNILLKIITSAGERRRASESGRSSMESAPVWQRILALEAVRSLCSDGVLMRNLWRWFDGKDQTARVFTLLVETLHRVSIESPALIGKASAIHQLNQVDRRGSDAERRGHEKKSSASNYARDIYGAAAGVANAAIGSMTALEEGGVGLSQSAVPGIQLIDQLDKTEAPNLPPTYIYLLALQSIVHLSQSMSAITLSLYARVTDANDRGLQQAPGALDYAKLSDSDRTDAMTVQNMIKQVSGPLLDTLTFFLTSNCDTLLFAEVLVALRNLACTAGVLNLESPRDAIIASLKRLAVPSNVLAKYLSSRRGEEESDATLSERNRACLKAIMQVAFFLAGALNVQIREPLEAICDAEFVLSRSGESQLMSSDDGAQGDKRIGTGELDVSIISAFSKVATPFSSSEVVESASAQTLLKSLDTRTLQAIGWRVISRSAALDSASLLSFLQALCELNAQQIGLGGAVPNVERNIALTNLTTVALLNVERLTHDKSMAEGWDLVTNHFVLAAKQISLRPATRVQAADALDRFLQGALASRGNESSSVVQQRVFAALSEQCALDNRRASAADIDIRRLGLETVIAILQVRGHEITIRWDEIFSMLETAAAPASDDSDRSVAPLIKAAFGALQIICSELLSKLDTREIRLCVKAMSQFAQQKEDINVALTANGAIWAITAEVSARAETSDAEVINALWVNVLSSLQQVTSDSRMQVRHGAISLLFRVLEQYGPTLPAIVWTESVMPQILWPLLNYLRRIQTGPGLESKSADADNSSSGQWEESLILALTSTGRVVRQSGFDKLLEAPALWDKLFTLLKEIFLSGPNSVSQAAIKAFHEIIDIPVEGKGHAQFISVFWRSWSTWNAIGSSLKVAPASFSQANLKALTDALGTIYRNVGRDFTTTHLQEMLVVLRSIMTYGGHEERISDASRLSALQSAILDRLAAVHMSNSAPALLVETYTELSLLAFGKLERRSYLALNRAATDAIVRIVADNRANHELYTSGAVAATFDALAVPVGVRYDCPARPGQKADIWKTSLVALCKMAEVWCSQFSKLELDADVVGKIWTNFITAVTSALAADCTAVVDMDPDEQEDEDMYDLMVLATIETKVWCCLGNAAVPDSCIHSLAITLANTSRLTLPAQASTSQNGILTPPIESDENDAKMPRALFYNGCAQRERCAYWCLEMLIMLSSKTKHGPTSEQEARRIAKITLPRLIHRFEQTIVSYIARYETAGASPLPRVADEEINFIFSKLLHLQLWPGTLETALDVELGEQEMRHRGERSSASSAGRANALTRHLYPFLCDFLLEVVPKRAGRTGDMPLVACGTSQIYLKPIVLPAECALGTIGRSEQALDGSAGFNDAASIQHNAIPRADSRRLARTLLASLNMNGQ